MAGRLGIDAAAWARLSPLLDEALELPPEQRAAWLAALPAAQADLASTLRELVLDAPQRLLAPLSFGEPAVPGRSAGQTIGPYRLLHLLGAGGMGEVWSAERVDGLLQRQVALKLPRAGGLPHDLATRMARERDILAALVHPNIARLYDAGVGADGQPFMALELVAGERIDVFAAQGQLDLPARLRLFVQAARAVAHAHAQLVVHRDLKPSNLLVDGQGQVKLLDFGIAKLLQPDTAPAGDLTQGGATPMTPGYASPEQVLGGAVDTRSDVYALGVLLYELLAGCSPYRPQHDSRAAVEEAVLTQEPLKPSEASADRNQARALRGDLDTIVLHALKKAPGERYATADALADDIERHLEHRPVLARPDSLRYALGRLVRRNRVAFGAATAATLALLVGAALALWQAQRALAERERAEQVKAFVTGILRDANIYQAGPGGQLSAVDLVRQAQQRFQAARIDQPEVRIELGKLIAESLIALGDAEAAEPLLQDTLQQARRELGAADPQTIRARLLMSQLDRLRGRAAQQRAEFEDLLPLLRVRAEAEPELLVVGLQHQTLNAVEQGRYDLAVEAAEEGFRLARDRLGERHAETVASTLLLAFAHRYAKHPAQALEAAERGWQLAQQVHGGRGLHPRLVEARLGYGRSLADVGRLQEGVAQIELAAGDARPLYGESSQMVGTIRQNLVAYRIDLGQLAAAEADVLEAVRSVLPAVQPESFPYASTLAAHGNVLLAQRRHAEALERLAPAAATLDRVFGPGHDAALMAHAQEAHALAELRRLDAAQRTLDAALPRSQGAGVTPLTRARLAHVQAVVERLRGDPGAAAQRLQALLADTDPAPRLQRERARARVELGLDLLAQGRREPAAAAFETALAELSKLEVERTPWRADAESGLSRTRTP